MPSEPGVFAMAGFIQPAHEKSNQETCQEGSRQLYAVVGMKLEFRKQVSARNTKECPCAEGQGRPNKRRVCSKEMTGTGKKQQRACRGDESKKHVGKMSETP